ncbi:MULTISPECIES: aminotransferase class V-fold PLP-dependent enzyme [Psychrobacter]|jgi:aspartate aminotransferase-like enzyme|uniref:aminotransferase class V-fold PLP-dependent enzyme n=1 Tax=Psychrobacter TaxID=497 RepID=UPI000C327A7F|nr:MULTISPECIES: aminotransferase class V-fold PLP-dependent enzyme [Psychrobacter]MBA6243754.1 alanine--glyoxylate aminotransferase family protein [Psychrobacter sp. Urea-trap-18]MBA6285942.1 alanine--glyoxylate aminotransferase family protein [Psychrobacter sp. Urea-trap-16]MBA6319435.1 alanine--glyoxylate aminotransferase family protein [Psychrobacter sp. Urea-trap-20]MBA6334194.1 alanine--glyoxylate aminotransferase family protein [Psychrobacter sp. Urea-trap-19]PKG60805.1 aminotransferase
MPALRQDIDPNGLLEYSVVYTDRALNHMSKAFQQVMNDLSSDLKSVYNADAMVIVPGSGTYGMEAVARQLANDEDCLIIRNGWFSYRWTQILEKGKIAKSSTVLTANRADNSESPKPFAPVDIDVAVAKIKEEKPAVVFAPHVETSSGIILSDDYIKALSEAVHSVGGLLVIDCIASGCVWLDMKSLGIDVLISAPQKGWSSTPGAGLVMLSDAAVKKVDSTESDSFSIDLKQWLNIMRAYENGGHAYHATMPTDSLRQFRDAINEAKAIGFDKLCDAQWILGKRIREVLEAKGVESVAAEGFKAPGVVVSYTERDDMHKGSAFAEIGVQIAAGVPLKVGEPDNFKTFRLGLFGLDKLTDIDGTVARFETALDKVLSQ